MIIEKAWELIQRSGFVEIGFVDETGMPNIRKTYIQQEYKSVKRHFISTNTSSYHVRQLMQNNKACLYYSDSETFEGLCLYGTVKLHFERDYKQFFWHEGDEKYYPDGIDDEDYCILEFCAETARYYGSMGKHVISADEIDSNRLDIPEFDLNS